MSPDVHGHVDGAGQAAYQPIEAELDELYRDVILDHYRRPRNRRALDHATARGEGDNPLCGDVITVELLVRDGRIADVGFAGAGCAISQASASMMTEAVSGRSLGDARRRVAAFKQLMTSAQPPADDLGDLEALEGVRKFPVRVKCATLAWNVLEDALGQQGPSGDDQGRAMSETAVLEQLKAVEDPELHLNIVELGLVYGVECPEPGSVKVRMTLTSPACPYAPMLLDLTKAALRAMAGVKHADVEVVWSPPWDPRAMASDEVKAALGIWD